MKLKSWLILGIAVLTAACILGLFFMLRAEEIGAEVGNASGNAVGWALGSFHGITEGTENGERDGKEAALSAADTAADPVSRIEGIGRLEVLAAGVKLNNVHSIGEKYSAIYLMKGSAVYTIDLAKAEIVFSADQKSLTIRLPEPELDLYVDENETKKLAEYQEHSYTGNTRDGYTAYLNSARNTVAEVKKSMANYDELMTMAKDSAVSQVTRLAQAVCAPDTRVEVLFAEPVQEGA